MVGEVARPVVFSKQVFRQQTSVFVEFVTRNVQATWTEGAAEVSGTSSVQPDRSCMAQKIGECPYTIHHVHHVYKMFTISFISYLWAEFITHFRITLGGSLRVYTLHAVTIKRYSSDDANLLPLFSLFQSGCSCSSL